MSTPEEQQPVANCPKCGAQQPQDLKACWLCGAELDNSTFKPAVVDPVRATPERFSFSLSTLLLLMTLASVCFGLLIVAKGLAIPMCILLVPVLVRTIMVVRRREAAGLPVSRTQKIGLMATSFGVASVLAVVVSTAAFAGFCGVCLLLFSVDKQYGDGGMFVFGVGMCALSAAAVWGTAVIVKWIRRRYKRDIGQ